MYYSMFKPALVVVDLQEDFCPPHGSLAVPDGRAVVPVVNALLRHPGFALRVATKDWHPPHHISFAANHPGARPFADSCTITHPTDPAAGSYTSRLWPVHCVQDTPGAALVPELDAARLDRVIHKGIRPDVEMYSAFYDPLRVSDSGLAALLRGAGVTHVYVVGLAADYCVRSTALDALTEGFQALIVEEGTRAVDPSAWEACKGEIERAGVRVVSVDGPEVRRLIE